MQKIPLFLAVLILSLFHSRQPMAAVYTCSENHSIEIVYKHQETVVPVCEAAGTALDFLKRYGLDVDSPITIKIVEGVIISNDYVAYGSYDRTRDVIRLMSFSSIMKGEAPMMYDQPFDLEHYRGAVAHEIVHAVFYHNSPKVEDQLTNATQEYLAHATQLAVLPHERRQQIIAENDVGPWESGDSISEVYMALNPSGFAVKSYLHLTRLEDPESFINILLAHNWFYVSVP